MSAIRAAAVGAAGLGYLAAHALATVRDTRRWPVSPYNMFNRTLPERFPQPRCTLLDGDRWTSLLPVYGLMPLDFFRTVGIMRSVYLECRDPDVQAEFTRLLLAELNERPWRAFDEIRAPHRPSGPEGFRDLQVWEVWIELTATGAGSDPAAPRLLYGGLGVAA